MQKYFVLFLSLFLIVCYVKAEELTISCTHPELCKTAEIIISENAIKHIHVKNLVHIVGDPHEHGPHGTEIKNIQNADILLTGPRELNPWMKNIRLQRNKKLIKLELPEKSKILYPHASREQLSHFWLFPEIYCTFHQELQTEILQLAHLPTPAKNSVCQIQGQKLTAELKQLLEKWPWPIVLTHDALAPFLESLNIKKLKLISIRGSGHHEEISPQAIKKLFSILKESAVTWAIEEDINIPGTILSKVRTKDQIIKFSGAKARENKIHFAILQDFLQKMQGQKAVAP